MIDSATGIMFAVFMMLDFGAAGAYVALCKNRPWLEGLLAGLMLGPIGPVVMALLPTLGAPEYPASEYGEALRAIRDGDGAPPRRYTDAEWAARAHGRRPATPK